MSDSRAFTKFIGPVGSGSGEDNTVHQTAPAWVVTFVRWENRDTLRVKNISTTQVRDPLVVENDCLLVQTGTAKGQLTPSVQATFVMTDVNYETAVAPGDFMFVNMLNWETEARRVADNARAKKPINGPNDGFKGIFKVQSVRRTLTVDPNSGTKAVLIRISGYAFTEFNNTIYFNPYLIDPNQDPKNQLLFASYIGKDWAHLINQKGLVNVQDIIAVLIQSFIGNGIDDSGRIQKGNLVSPNVHFFIPDLVGRLLGIKGAKAAKDVYNYLFGIQKYSAGSHQSLAAGMNPAGAKIKFGRFYYTPTPCEGSSFLKPEYWNQVKTWSILNQYTNAPLNEMYTCFRISPNGRVMPTLVLRQIPFTNEDFKVAYLSVTKFLNLPRWKISPALVLAQDLGREEAARINFVQYFGRSTVGIEGADIAMEIAQGNFVYEIGDVQRSGLRPYIVTTQFDEPTTVNKTYRSPNWAKILGDALIGGHLKMNGTLECAGIVDPISVGDNLEFDGIVYHIEQIMHVCSYSAADGRRMFRTNINMSSGVSVHSSTKGTRYAEMENQSALSERTADYNNNQILPGVSESQDTVYRVKSLDYPAAGNKPFPQPGPHKTPKKGDDT